MDADSVLLRQNGLHRWTLCNRFAWPADSPATCCGSLCVLQLVSLLADRGLRLPAKAAALPPAPDNAAAAAAAAANLPVWLVHWRLRAALSSQQLFTELFIELSEAAAKCYSQCGHLRNASLLRADVADALVKAGQLERATELYSRQCHTFLR